MILDGAQHAETVDDVVRDEGRRGVVSLAVVAVVVALARPYVVGERRRNLPALAVAGYEVGDVVTHHPAEPPALVALMREVVSDVGGGGYADLDVLGVPARLCCCVVDVLHGPLQDHGVRELEDEAVGLAPDEVKGRRAVAGHPDVELAILYPRDADLVAACALYLPPFGQLLDDVHRLLDPGQRRRLLAEYPLCRVAAADAADRAVSEHVVEGGEER